jgi:hypothetical protein
MADPAKNEKGDINPQDHEHESHFWTHHLHSRRLRSFLHHPTGRKVHVAGSPEEVDGLTKTLTGQGLQDHEWDVVIQGSADHVGFGSALSIEIER